VIRTSNGYIFTDPLEAEPGRRVLCKTENPAGLLKREKKIDGAPLVAAQVMSEEASQAPPEQTEAAVAPQREHGLGDGARLSAAERAALVARQDAGEATKADWVAYDRELHALLTTRLGPAR